jgi:hypothetical protein
MLNFYLTNFEVEQKYQQEALGIVNGMIASGADTNITGMDRDIMMEDVLLVNSLIDMYYYRSVVTGNNDLQLGCASLSSWGSATQSDSLLTGHSIISRFLDWNQDNDLIANPLLMVSQPAESDEQPWVSFTYPGMIGALSAISASGKSAFLNMGNVHSYNDIDGLHPILLSIRNGIESTDYNADGTDNITDIYAAVEDQTSLSGTIIHTISEINDVQAGVIETNNANGTVMRGVGQYSGLPGMHLAATNHFRRLASSVCCTRYSNIADSLSTNQYVSAKRQLSLLSGAAGMDNNLMAMQYTPYTGKIIWSTATELQPAFQNEMTPLYLDELLDFSMADADHIAPGLKFRLNVFPNPARNNQLITIKALDWQKPQIAVYNLKGQLVTVLPTGSNETVWNGKAANGERAAKGIYLIRAVDPEGNHTAVSKLLLLD